MNLAFEPVPPLSATALRDWSRCERRYGFSRLEKRAWPAPAPEPPEARLGARFHQLAHWHAQGDDPRPLLAGEPRLNGWYQRYRTSAYARTGPGVWSEQALAMPFQDGRLMATFDRLIQDGDFWTIVDWKTGRPPADANRLALDWQTRLYPFLLAEAAPALPGGPAGSVVPEAIQMVYVYVETGQVFPFVHDALTHQATHRALEETLAAIRARLASRDWRPTGTETGACRGCAYFALCHMAPPPPEPAPEAGEEPAEEPLLTLAPEFEFEDTDVFL